MNPYRAVLFDFDGTLMDTSPGVITCLLQTLVELGIHEEHKEVLQIFWEPPAGEFFIDAYGFSESQAQKASLPFRQKFQKGSHLDAIPYEGIKEFIFALRNFGCRTAVATNKQQKLAQSMIQHFHFAPCFDAVCGASEHKRLQKWDIVQQALD
ncbi:HAD hydrolase-like protein [Flintibacter sp. HCN-6482]|uniref:HAD hydrolase-like protein n=1 Tax=Flintibacter sp. HCN-6482 TaxID=3134672 RepID=UPI0030C09A38